MKSITFLSCLLLSVVTYATLPEMPETLVEHLGSNTNGTQCAYTVMKMNHWEGQTAIFINAESGNFRVELDTDLLAEGLFKSPYSDVTITLKGDILSITIPASEMGDVPKQITIILQNGDILQPLEVRASHGSEYLNCSF